MTRYYSAIDRFFNRFRKKGFFIYTSIVVAATIYSMYSLSNLPDVREIKDKETKRLRDKKKKKANDQVEKDKESKLKESDDINDPIKKELAKDHNQIDNWTRKQLYSFLGKHNIFPNLDITLDDLKEQAKAVFYNDIVAEI
ncbi:hypothetical protein CAAN1_02S01310 [[Candida] anglica]|uniref:Uncharacterized protein n=1 Tax=[Candida] anglica TaxID=148631 RepID=A0ABP0E6I1_9ASCO